jgi:hypothetical protein
METPEVFKLSYRGLLERAAEASTVPERLLASPAYDLRALADVNRDLQYVLTHVVAADRDLDKALTKGFLRTGPIRRLLEEHEDDPTAQMMRRVAIVFQRALPEIKPHLKSINTLLKQQTGTRNWSKAAGIEPEIQQHLKAIGDLINITYRTEFFLMAQGYVSLAPKAPELLQDAQYLATGRASFWIFVEFLAVIEIYLVAVSGLSK